LIAQRAGTRRSGGCLEAKHPTGSPQSGGTLVRPDQNSTLINQLAQASGKSASQVTAAPAR
jgi:hypothetical protein